MTMLTSFVNMKGRKEDKSIEALWEAYRKAEQLDQINKMSDIIEEIKAKARRERMSWDFYKACGEYVDVKARRNWKMRDSLRTRMKQEIEEYDEPLLTYLLYADHYYDEKLLERVQEDASRLREGHNQAVYLGRGALLSSAVAHSVSSTSRMMPVPLQRGQTMPLLSPRDGRRR